MRRHGRKQTLLLTLIIPTILIFVATKVQAEIGVSYYVGKAHTFDTEVTLTDSQGTIEFLDVPFADESFTSPIYYGIKVFFWFESSPNWGLSLDFTHIKMVSDLSDTVSVHRTGSGTSTTTREPLGDTFSELQFSHGHNLLTLGGAYRWFPAEVRDGTFLGRLQLYAGLGLGIAITHVEITIADDATSEYQIGGFAAQGNAGVNFDVTRHLAGFIEFRLSHATIDADLAGGKTAALKPLTHQLAFGVSLGWR